MPQALTHYYFAKDLLKTLEEKYLEQANITDPKLFLYSNFYDLAYYYKPSGLFAKDSYNLANKIHKTNASKLIKEAILYTRNNGYDKDNVTMIYAMVSHYILDLFFYPYINYYSSNNNKSIQQLQKEIDYHFSKEIENIELGKTNLVKRFQGAYLLNFEDHALIEHIIKKTCYVSRTYEYYNKSLKEFKKQINPKYKIHKLFHSKTKDLIYDKKYDYNEDILNKNNTLWFNSRIGTDTTISLLGLYNEALQEGKKYLSAALNYLYLNNSKEFDKLFVYKNIN